MTGDGSTQTQALFGKDSLAHALAQQIDDFHAEGLRRSEATRQKFAHQLGLHYGDHPRHVFDVYSPPDTAPGDDLPVLAWLHGGGFRMGDTDDMAYVGELLLERGAIFISAAYRILPDAAFPDCADDIEQLLVWLEANVGDLGGDPEQIYLGGLGAGATVAVEAGLHPQSMRPDLIKGLVAASATCNFDVMTEEMGNRVSARWVSSLPDAFTNTPPHTILAIGSDDQLGFPAASSKTMAAALAARGASVELLELYGVDHFHTGDSLADGGELFEAVRRMMALPQDAQDSR